MTSGSSRPYIELYDSTGSGGYFRVVQGGYKPVRDKSGVVNRTAGGGIDHSVGAIYEVHQYTIWCRDEEIEPGYKDRSELMRLFSLNNPNGTPTNVITLHDHFDVSHSTLMVGQELPEPVTTMLSGEYAWFFYPITLHFIRET